MCLTMAVASPGLPGLPLFPPLAHCPHCLACSDQWLTCAVPGPGRGRPCALAAALDNGQLWRRAALQATGAHRGTESFLSGKLQRDQCRTATRQGRWQAIVKSVDLFIFQIVYISNWLNIHLW